jgi:SAM-dependent methyltransferase
MEESTHVGAQHFYQTAVRQTFNWENKNGLIVGYGKGHESEYLGSQINGRVFGIDVVRPEVNPHAFAPAIASALHLPFAAHAFSFVFYHHVIEHVPDARLSLLAIYRVLKPGGILYVGTPNRHRLVGYVGSYNTPLRNKIKWNLIDYKARLQGRFRNELGAHAGFSQRELARLLAETGFAEQTWLTDDYLRFKYGRRLPKAIMQLVTRQPLMEITAPAVYVLCRK